MLTATVNDAAEGTARQQPLGSALLWLCGATTAPSAEAVIVSQSGFPWMHYAQPGKTITREFSSESNTSLRSPPFTSSPCSPTAEESCQEEHLQQLAACLYSRSWTAYSDLLESINRKLNKQGSSSHWNKQDTWLQPSPVACTRSSHSCCWDEQQEQNTQAQQAGCAAGTTLLGSTCAYSHGCMPSLCWQPG